MEAFILSPIFLSITAYLISFSFHRCNSSNMSIAEIACKIARDTFRLVSGIFLSTNPLLR